MTGSIDDEPHASNDPPDETPRATDRPLRAAGKAVFGPFDPYRTTHPGRTMDSCVGQVS